MPTSAPTPLRSHEYGLRLAPPPASPGDKIDKVIRLDLELLELVAQIVAEHSLRACLILQCLINAGIDRGNEVDVKPHGPVMLDDSILNFIDREMPGRAVPF